MTSDAQYSHFMIFRAKEHLGKTIQAGGGTVGHSSVEDSVATLDLVRYFMLNKPKLTTPASASTATSLDSASKPNGQS